MMLLSVMLLWGARGRRFWRIAPAHLAATARDEWQLGVLALVGLAPGVAALTAWIHLAMQAQILHELALDDLSTRYPGELSIGQQQLAAIARALAANPPLSLADEPTANLDTTTARQIMARLRALTDGGRHGVVIASHDLRMASQADRVLNLRDGALVKETAMQPGRATRELLAELM